MSIDIFNRAARAKYFESEVSDIIVDYDADTVSGTVCVAVGDDADHFAVKTDGYVSGRKTFDLAPPDSKRWQAVLNLPQRVPGDHGVILSGDQLPRSLSDRYFEVWRHRETQEIWGEYRNAMSDRDRPVDFSDFNIKK